MIVKVVLYLVNGTKYKIRYRQDSGLDKGQFRQVTVYPRSIARKNKLTRNTSGLQ